MKVCMKTWLLIAVNVFFLYFFHKPDFQSEASHPISSNLMIGIPGLWTWLW